MKTFEKFKVRTQIIILYNLLTLSGMIALYVLLPFFLSYGPFVMDSVGAKTLLEQYMDSYKAQYITVGVFIFLVAYIYLKTKLKGIDNVEHDNTTLEKLNKLPTSTYYFIVFFPTIVNCILFAILYAYYKYPIVMYFKVILILMSMGSLVYIIVYTLLRSIISKKLEKIFIVDDFNKKKGSIVKNFRLLVIPIIFFSSTIVGLSFYSMYITEKGDLAYDYLSNEMKKEFAGIKIRDINLLETQNKIKNINNKQIRVVQRFIIKDTAGNYKMLYNEGEPSKMLFIYIQKYIDNNKAIYDFSGDIQITAVRINNYIVGVRYKLYNIGAFIKIIFMVFFVLALSAFAMGRFTKAFKNNIDSISSNLSNMTKNIELTSKIPITTDDELASLVIAFNKVQEMTLTHIAMIKKDQELIAQRERLASLGELSGGIAHNLGTSIMVCAAAINEIEKKTNNIDKQKYPKETEDINEWSMEIRNQIEYMEDVVNTLKSQTVGSSVEEFSVLDLVKRVSLLMNFPLKRSKCQLVKKINVNKDTKIYGDISQLVQVLNNVISNSIDAYEGKPGKIEFIIGKEDDNIKITIKDYAKGIPEKIKNRLFDYMTTTKGKNGSGLGLYISKAVITGNFGGNIKLESEDGVGTSINIFIPDNRGLLNGV